MRWWKLPEKTLVGERPTPTVYFAASPDGSRIVAGGWGEDQLSLIDADMGRLLAS